MLQDGISYSQGRPLVLRKNSVLSKILLLTANRVVRIIPLTLLLEIFTSWPVTKSFPLFILRNVKIAIPMAHRQNMRKPLSLLGRISA